MQLNRFCKRIAVMISGCVNGMVRRKGHSRLGWRRICVDYESIWHFWGRFALGSVVEIDYAYIAMKTNHEYQMFPRLAMFRHGLGYSFLSALCVAVLSAFTAAPQAYAAAPDGTYRLVTASGSLTVGGEPLELDAATIKSIIGSSTGKVVVLNSQIKLNRSGAVTVFQKLGESLGFEVTASISGPKLLTLTKSGTTYVGKTPKPVVANVTVDTGTEVMYGIIRSNFKVVVQGRTMTVNVPVSGELFGMPLKGQLKATCRR